VLQVTSAHVLDGYRVQLFDFHGRKVMEYSNLSGSRFNLDARPFSRGIYLCLVVDEKGAVLDSHKLIVE
jgi:hypothetical protein